MKNSLGFALLALSVLLSTSLSCAQKVKIKDEVVYIDKQKTPLKLDVEHKSVEYMGDFHQIYKFSDSAKDDVFLLVEYKGVKIPGVNGKYGWLEISDGSKSKINSVDFEGGLFSSKQEIVLELINKYQFFNRQGVIDRQKIADFMALETSSTAKTVASKGLESFAKVRELDPYIGSDLTIRQGGPTGEVIGRVGVSQNQSKNEVSVYRVFDLDENEIATALMQPNIPSLNVTLIDKTHFQYRTGFGLSSQVGGTPFLTELVEKVIHKGYFLGSHYTETNISSNLDEI